MATKPTSRFFELHDTAGLAPAFVRNDQGLEVPNERVGEPDPLTEIGVNIPMPTMVGDQVATTTAHVAIRPADVLDEQLQSRILPGTRIVETTHPAVGSLLLETGLYHEIDPPRSVQPHKPKTTGRPGQDKE